MTLLLAHRRPTLADRYRITKELDRGTTCQVLEAVDTEMQTSVAIKLLQDECCYPRMKRGLIREGETLARLNHPQIVHLLAIDRQTPFLVLELLRGRSIKQMLDDASMATMIREVEWVARVCREICKGLSAIHHDGFLHGDMKPASVMIDGDRVTIVDLSITRSVEEPLGPNEVVEAGTFMASPCYLSPEQAIGKGATPQSDIFALGIMLFVLLTRFHPFHIDPQNPKAIARTIVQEKPWDLSKYRADLRSLDPFFRAMFAKKPDDRPSLKDIEMVFLGFLPDASTAPLAASA